MNWLRVLGHSTRHLPCNQRSSWRHSGHSPVESIEIRSTEAPLKDGKWDRNGRGVAGHFPQNRCLSQLALWRKPRTDDDGSTGAKGRFARCADDAKVRASFATSSNMPDEQGAKSATVAEQEDSISREGALASSSCLCAPMRARGHHGVRLSFSIN